MMKQTFLSALLFLSTLAVQAQSKEYTEWITKANAFYDAKDYQKSANAFTHVFATNGGKGSVDDRYNAACTWALAGNADSAFFMLTRIATKSNFIDIAHLLADTDLATLHSDKRWAEVCAIVIQNKDKAEANIDHTLVATLDTIFKDDQNGRVQLMDIDKKYGPRSDESREQWKIISKKDSVDLIKVERILDKYGWVGPDVAGQQGSTTIFLVIQHADIKTQEKYLPMMREAVKNNKAQPRSLALLEDRVALREGKKQIYGSQINVDEKGNYYVDELEDPDNVDKRRVAVGLNPIAEYIQTWGLKWDVAEYKKQLPEIEKRNR